MFKYLPYSAYSLTNLANSEIFLNEVSRFNDPFECRSQIVSGFPDLDDQSPRFHKLLQAWGFEDVSAIDALENYQDYVMSLEGSEPDIEALIAQARICCFSRRGDSPLLWSHYADGLRGFCIEFDPALIEPPEKGSGKFFEVLYEHSPATIDTAVLAVLRDQSVFHEDAVYEERDEYWKAQYEIWLGSVYAQTDSIYQRLLATKHAAWSYEEELRLICNATTDGTGEALRYPEQAVKAIIIGERMSLKHVQTMRSLLKNSHGGAQLKQAKLIPGTFKLEIVNLEDE